MSDEMNTRTIRTMKNKAPEADVLPIMIEAIIAQAMNITGYAGWGQN